MYQSSAPAVDAPLVFNSISFTQEEHDFIAAWVEEMEESGLSAETFSDIHGFFDDVVLVSSRLAGKSSWLISKTPTEGFAVRVYPGVVRIVATLQQALTLVTGAAGC